MPTFFCSYGCDCLDSKQRWIQSAIKWTTKRKKKMVECQKGKYDVCNLLKMTYFNGSNYDGCGAEYCWTRSNEVLECRLATSPVSIYQANTFDCVWFAAWCWRVWDPFNGCVQTATFKLSLDEEKNCNKKKNQNKLIEHNECVRFLFPLHRSILLLRAK